MIRIRTDNRKLTMTGPKVAGSLLLILGIVLLGLSIGYSASIPAFAGLGLIFWGIILIYIQTEDYAKSTVLDATAKSLLTSLNQTLEELDYRGKAVYLPPKYLNDPEATKIYLPKQPGIRLPPPDQTQKLERQTSQRNPQGMLIVPPGADLTKLFEEALGAKLIGKTLKDLEENMPKLLIEDLELATEFTIQTPAEISPQETGKTEGADQKNHDTIHVRITTDLYPTTRKQAQQQLMMHGNIGCPVTSAIACTLAKATGKPVVIENQQTTKDGKTTETEYRILEDET
ncbi:MAG: hypothetical protein ABSB28_01855 [Candidatus Bathyarchaeia archaeon]